MPNFHVAGPSTGSLNLSPHAARAAAIALLTVWVAGTASLAAEPEAEPQLPRRGEQPYRVQARAGHIAFESFGRDSSLTHVELMPMFRGDRSLLFGEVRFFGTNEGYFGGNVGVGYRWYLPASDRFWGGKTLVQNAAGAGVAVSGAARPVTFPSLQVTANGAGPAVRIADSPGKVSFQDLDLTSNHATALEVRNSGTTAIAAGNITAVNAPAVDMENTTMDVALTSVSSSGAVYGLRIVDSAGQFLVYGKDTLGTGGVIRDAATGVLVAGSGTVGLRYLDLNSNATAMDVSRTQYLALAGARVTDSLDYAIRSRNTTMLGVTNSIFENNGGAGRNTVLAVVDTAGTYTNAFIGNKFTDAIEAVQGAPVGHEPLWSANWGGSPGYVLPGKSRTAHPPGQILSSKSQVGPGISKTTWIGLPIPVKYRSLSWRPRSGKGR